MKKFCISFLLCAIIVLTAVAFITNDRQVNTEYLRVHIRANSNLQIDQNVKYLVKDAVIDYLTPKIAFCKTKQQAKELLEGELTNIERVANKVLKANGFDYTSNAKLNEQEFPTRVYNGLELEAGYYDALILELGKGAGDNWWCVVYPPLCFVDSSAGYVYKSKIYEIINDFLKKRGTS